MPKLTSLEKHNCIICSQSFASRARLKDHLIKAKKNGKPRCPGLKKVIPPDVWVKDILPHYSKDVKLPDLSEYAQIYEKSPSPSYQ